MNTVLQINKNSRKGMILPLAAIGIAGTLYAVTWNRRRKTAESSQTRMLEQIEHQQGSLFLAWKPNGTSYRAFRDKELVYEGPEPKLVDQNLVSGTLYTYCIETLDEDGDVTKRMRVQTTASHDSKEKENILQDMLLTTIISTGQVSFDWEPIEGVSEYTVFRNGIKLDTIKRCTFTDSGLNDEEEYIYRIKAKRPLQRSEQIKSEIKSLVANAVGIIKKDSSTEMAAAEEFSIIKKIGPIKNLLKSPMESQSANGNWHLRYTTFLKETCLTNPNAASADHYFKGDGRMFDPESSNFRTRADVFIDTENLSALLSKDTGVTDAFSKDNEQIETGQASDEGIQLEKVLTDDEMVKFQLKHAVSNPLVVSPAIDYLVCGTFYKNGDFDLVGAHDQAPEHEVYLKEPGAGNWEVIHQAESKGLEMMAAPMADHYWRYSTFTQ
ncbi:DUF3238 domain-containing protein [Mesobacillus subterraneus]|uniref:DUF3238 domain-containing protein n=1 Tax=Mesobacillus subterraneus TaxID=285983 RepID=A0A3R9F2W3_9BACI|nr:DUF3238 domain-containing protein [Mesobacillus subterraneus]RSD28727.1 DUF3238 domain-containing protein [Mesobacillus subterraneus]